MAQLGRIRLRQAGGDLGEPGVTCNERRTAGRRGFRSHHPEGFREDRRDDARVRHGEQVDEVPVLERAGERDVLRSLTSYPS